MTVINYLYTRSLLWFMQLEHVMIFPLLRIALYLPLHASNLQYDLFLVSETMEHRVRGQKQLVW